MPDTTKTPTQQALEALRKIDTAISALPEGLEGHLESLDEPMDAARAAIAALEAEQAQAAQAVPAEPVAWRVRRHDAPSYWIAFLHKPVDALKDPEREVQPLYTAPQPVAVPQPLTKHQCLKLLLELNAADMKTETALEVFTTIVRAVEKLHGIAAAAQEEQAP